MLVCLGNPPYGRHEAATADNKNRTGGWIRWGDETEHDPPPLDRFADPVKAAGHGVQLKNLYNLYVYFWRWALWKVFEQKGLGGTGAVSFITASSWLDGPAFAGMREHMRRVCDEIWVLDLGGEGRGPRKSENIFDIQTPVAIVMACRTTGKAVPDRPAKVRYARFEGTRAEKLAALNGIQNLTDVKWLDGPDGWGDPFLPPVGGPYFGWPLLTDLMPWQHSGVQLKRTWPIAPDKDTLERRWRKLLRPGDRRKAFRETGGHKVTRPYRDTITGQDDPTPLSELPDDAPMPEAWEYAYRSFDRQRIIADGRVITHPRPDLWRAHGGRQLYLNSLLTKALGSGPALTCATAIPDIDHFGSGGGKDVVPLYRSADASEANVAPGLLGLLGEGYGHPVSAEDLAAYVYGALAHPAFTERFATELESRELRIPLTRDAALFGRVRDHGARLLHIHTWARRFVSDGLTPGIIESGTARCTVDVGSAPPEKFSYDPETRTLKVGDGAFAPVAPEVYGFEVSGLQVVRSWLRYRMRDGAGRKSSPLDDTRPERWTAQFTDELLELLWVLEATVEGYAHQAELLEEIVAGECIQADELPTVPKWMRKPPAARPVASAAAPPLDLPPSS